MDSIRTASPPRSAADLFSVPADKHPLCFKSNLFLSPNFDSESYISELRTFVPCETLRSKIQAHLSSLNHELIDIINRDYEDFVNLSIHLGDVDAAIVRTRVPLLELRENKEGFKRSAEGSLVALQIYLKQSTDAAYAREVLQLLLDTFNVVSKFEKLMEELPSVSDDGSDIDVDFEDRKSMSNSMTVQLVENGTNVREMQSMLLERIASEMNRLKFYIAYAQNLPFLDNMDKKNIPLGSSEAVPGTSGDEIETDYKQIKQCIGKDCKFFLDISSAGYFPSRSAVAKFRAEPIYSDFIKQWNVGVYFSLRFQEIAGSLDSALTASSLAPVRNANSDKGNSRVLTLKQSITLLDSLKSCWREDVFLLSCSDKFLRLSLQLLSRYSHWLSSGLAARRPNASSNTGCEWAISASPDDFIYIIHDINCLAKEVSGDYLTHVLKLLSSCSSEVLALVKKSILDSGKSLSTLIPIAINTIVDALVEKAVEDFRQLKRRKLTYRMTNNSLPVRPSPYVSGVLSPLKTLLEGEPAMKYLASNAKNKLLLRAATEITSHYHELAAHLISTARKPKSSLLKIRQGAQRWAGARLGDPDHNVYVTDNISMQLFLDIQEYGHNLAALGVQAADIPAYRSLWHCVAPPNRQNVIKF